MSYCGLAQKPCIIMLHEIRILRVTRIQRGPFFFWFNTGAVRIPLST
jgi:hypothetical protein